MERGERMKLIPFFIKISMTFGCLVLLIISWLCGIEFAINSKVNGIVYYLSVGILIPSLILISIGIILIMFHIWESVPYE